ncbi:MAG: glycine--tRNA ligase subunit beta [Alphaproteobacteria bacterium]|jgi:glycyl-tRNA synthetase beta chain|nr:glycine--tRNA ligase subunit beta [Alphaproteobacteria bacterium]
MAELLLEIMSEEIPAGMQRRAAEDLRRLVTDGLTAVGLDHDKAEVYWTPRRLALVVDDLPSRQPDMTEERKGPRADAPAQAIEGFLGSVGLTRDQVEERETDKGAVLYAVIENKGEATAEILPALVAEAIGKLSWPKSMRWGTTFFRWVRPIRSILCVFDGRPLEGGLRIADVEVVDPSPEQKDYKVVESVRFSNETQGHPFLAPKEFKVEDFADYKAKLRKAKVVLDAGDRRAKIERGLEKLAKAEGLTLKDDPALLDEVAGLVEWPVVHLGVIDEEFTELPPEVLTASMRSHQRYFSLLDAEGALASRFGLVANMTTRDKGRAIVAGNERVLRARLADAKFFWDQDQKVPLAERASALKGMVFHAKLGSLDEKMSRVWELADEIADHVPDAVKESVSHAARLAKADLVTGMVGEFPELQGVMGRYYALGDGESEDVADAIAEHYSPRGPRDRCPTAPVSVTLALADKIDTLVGFWAIDERPTGSRDPYALRRAALGVIRLIVENGLRVPLLSVFAAANALYHDHDCDGGDLLSFFADRLKVHLREQGVRHDLISAAFALTQEDDLVRLLARVEALQRFLDSEDGANLLVAYKRAANIVAIEEKKDGVTHDGAPDSAAFEAKEESALAEALHAAASRAGAAVEGEDFAAAMAALAILRRPVDVFFDEVTVNTDEPALRANRLRLLSEIRATMNQVADFGEIEG